MSRINNKLIHKFESDFPMLIGFMLNDLIWFENLGFSEKKKPINMQWTSMNMDMAPLW